MVSQYRASPCGHPIVQVWRLIRNFEIDALPKVDWKGMMRGTSPAPLVSDAGL